MQPCSPDDQPTATHASANSLEGDAKHDAKHDAELACEPQQVATDKAAATAATNTICQLADAQNMAAPTAASTPMLASVFEPADARLGMVSQAAEIR